MDMKLIVGLGNPGEKYEKTRHNIGFMIVEKFLRDFSQTDQITWDESSKFKSFIAQIEWQKQTKDKSPGLNRERLEKVALLKPKTYMNNSGMSVRLAADFYKIKPEDIWVVHDDLDLPLGSLKIRLGGASAGHRGIESIIESLGTDKFWRFRLGIGHPHKKNMENGTVMKMSKRDFGSVDNFVLGGFGQGEAGKVKTLIKKSVAAIETALETGLDTAMNRFNSK